MNIRCCLVGDFGVGKTSLMNSILGIPFSGEYHETIGVSMSSMFIDGVNYILKDTAGQERYASLLPIILRGSDVFIVCLDYNSTIDNFVKYCEIIDEVVEEKIIVACFTKSDLHEKLPDWTPNIIADYVTFTSAKTGQNIEALLAGIASLNKFKETEKILNKKEKCC